MKLEKMTPGMVLHDHGRARSILREKCSWPVEIISVDLENREVLASWNYNGPTLFSERHAMKWRKKSHWEMEKEKKP